MKKILYLMLFLAIVAAISGGALAFVNELSAPKIAAIALKAEKENLVKLFPDATDQDFEELKVKDSKTIQKIFKVKGKDFVFKFEVSGYDKGTVFMIAVNPEGKLLDYVAISNGDTKGIGSKVMEEPFRKSLQNKNIGKDKLDTISGATKSSSPIIEAIQEAGMYLKEHLK